MGNLSGLINAAVWPTKNHTMHRVIYSCGQLEHCRHVSALGFVLTLPCGGACWSSGIVNHENGVLVPSVAILMVGPICSHHCLLEVAKCLVSSVWCMCQGRAVVAR